MGEIRAKIRFENNRDRVLNEAGKLGKRKVRAAEVEAIVDTGAMMMLLPQDLVEDLGLRITGRELVILGNDHKVELPIAEDVHLTLVGREWTTDCLVGPPGCQALIGALIMERLDLIPDPKNRTITVRPESPLRPTHGLRELAPA